MRFLEAEFGRHFDGGDQGGPRTDFDPEQVALLRVIHERVFVQGEAVQEVHRELSQRREAVAPLQVIAVTSGKGGVGKTTVAINLASAMARAGRRTLLIDADLGMGNVHVLTGLTANGSITDVLRGSVAIEDVLVEGPEGVQILCGGSGIAGLADVKPVLVTRLGKELRELAGRFDAAIIDTGAGISSQVLAFLGLADDVVLVTTPDMSAMLDAYGVMKVLREGGMRTPVHVLVNQVEKPGDSEMVFDRIRACAQRYLDDEPRFLGSLKRDRSLREANRQRRPVAVISPGARSVKTLNQMAEDLHPQPKEGATRRSDTS